jgi:polyvinyl alcohol dehydrogenase (cytochrome)
MGVRLVGRRGGPLQAAGGALLLLLAGSLSTGLRAEETGGILPNRHDNPEAVRLYAARCAACHDQVGTRAPPKATMISHIPAFIESTLTSGAMRQQASGLTPAQIRLLAEYLTGKAAVPDGEGNQALCPFVAKWTSDGAAWSGWGANVANSRFHEAAINAGNLQRLGVKWAFAYPGGAAIGSAAVFGPLLYLTSRTGQVVALDAKSGCEHWRFQSEGIVKGPPVAGDIPDGTHTLFFADQQGQVYALNAQTGAALWQRRIGDSAIDRTGPLQLLNRTLYVPIGSKEELAASDPTYPCCRGSGAVVALDAATGTTRWQTTTVPGAGSQDHLGGHRVGPAGGHIWTPVALDAKRQRVYAVTGNSTTDYPTDGANAVFAFDLASGRVVWSHQVTKNDNWTAGCLTKAKAGCPAQQGPDDDFSGPPILAEDGAGSELVLALQKFGRLYAFDPDTGEIRWRAQIPDAAGRVNYGGAVMDGRLYTGAGGLSALDLRTGRLLFHTKTPASRCSWGEAQCNPAQSGAPTAISGLVFQGAEDGHVRAFDSSDGRIVWDFDTARQPHRTTTSVLAQGGAVGGAAIVVTHDRLYVTSGASGLGGRPGNLFLAFGIGDEAAGGERQ